MTLSRSKWITLFVVFIFGIITSPSFAFAEGKTKSQFARESLKEMAGVMVYVYGLDSNLEAKGITKEILKTDVELKLRLARIKIFEDSTDAKFINNGQPELQISIFSKNFGPSEINIIYVKLFQDADLRRGEQPTFVTTWEIQGMAYGPVGTSHTYIRGTLRDLVDSFINDYLAMNPKS